MQGFYHCDNVPREENKGAGYNYSRVCDEELNQLLEQAGQEFDQTKRKALFDQVQARVLEICPDVYLYNTLDVHAYNAKLQGWRHNVFVKQGWNSEDWWIKE